MALGVCSLLTPRRTTSHDLRVLFAKIEDTQVAEWAERFGGAGIQNG